ncbi:MAG: sensor histidine kinase [Saprospiraceae bacterium]
MMRRFVQWLLQNRALQHVLFWSLSFYILLRYFAYTKVITKSDLVYTLLFHISLMTVVYLNLLIWIPRLLKQGKYSLYLFTFIITLVLGVWLNQSTFNYIADWLFPGYYFISYYEWRDISQFMLIYLVASTLLKLSKAWFWLQETERRLEELQREKLDTELHALKAQLDPHFFFNSLNSLYALALDGDLRTPEAILKLSHNMHYMLYDCNANQVPLEKEIEFIHNYLDLQRLRLNKDTNIICNINIYNPKQPIAPLLFIPFVENAFKHGNKNTIQIKLTTYNKSLDFYIENKKKERQPELESQKMGIGLQNSRRRLELLYPNQHQLHIREAENHFFIHLHITFL